MNARETFLLKLQSIAIFLLFFCSMMPPFDCDLAGMSFLTFLQFGLAVFLAFLIVLDRKNRERDKKGNLIDVVALIMLVWEFLNLAGKVITEPLEEGAIDYQFQIVMLTLLLFYFAFKMIGIFKMWYLDLLLYFSLIGMAVLLYSYFTGEISAGILPDFFVQGIQSMNSGQVASYILLPCVVSSYQYCMCRNRAKAAFYLMMVGVSFFTLFLNQNIVSLWLMTGVLLMIPMVFRTTAELVKRAGRLLFLYLFLLGNMSLLTNYTDLFQREVAYHLEQGVYLELIAAIGGLLFARQWERIPEGIDLDRLVLRRMRRGYGFTLRLLWMTAAGLLLGAEWWKGLPESTFCNVVKGFALPLTEEIRVQKSTFVLCVEKDPLAAVLTLIFFSMLIKWLWKNHSYGKELTGGFLLLALVFGVQLLFWTPCENVLPIYLMMLVQAGAYQEKIRRVTSVKIKYEGKEEWKNEVCAKNCI